MKLRTTRLNTLAFYFLITQLGFYIAPLFAAPPLIIDLPIGDALGVHTLALVAFFIGYALNALLHQAFATSRAERDARRGAYQRGVYERARQRGQSFVRGASTESTAPGETQVWSRQVAGARTQARNEQQARENNGLVERWIFKAELFVAAYALTILGVVVVIAQVALFRPPTDYLRQLLSGNFETTIRDAFLAPSEQGGLSGMLKIFGAIPLSIYLFSLAVPHFFELSPDAKGRFDKLNRVAFIATCVKVLFSLDRLTILSVVIANVFLTARTRQNLRVKMIAVFAFIVLVEFVSQRREGRGALGFVVLYYNLGIVNLQLLVDTLREHTYGFGSILSPLAFVMEFLGLRRLVPVPVYEFRYAGAQYLVGYGYQDFGGFFWALFFAMGMLFKTLDRKALDEKNLKAVSIYFLALSATITSVAVPAFKSVDFWLGVLTPLMLVRYFARKTWVEAPSATPQPAAAPEPVQRPVRTRGRLAPSPRPVRAAQEARPPRSWIVPPETNQEAGSSGGKQ